MYGRVFFNRFFFLSVCFYFICSIVVIGAPNFNGVLVNMAVRPFLKIGLLCLFSLYCANGYVYETEDAVIVEGK